MSEDKNEVSVELDKSAADLLDPVEIEPRQVQSAEVVFVPAKDFEARVNRAIYQFVKDVPSRVSRDVAALLLQDKKNGYIRD